MPMRSWRRRWRASRSRVTTPAASAAGQNRFPGRANPMPTSAEYRLGLSPQSRSRMPAPTTSGSVRRRRTSTWSHSLRVPSSARRSTTSRPAPMRTSCSSSGSQPREEPPGEVVVRERPFALTLHHREVGGRVDREGVVQLHQRPRQPVTRHVQVARPRPRAAERAAPERQRLEIALDARYVGRGVARELDHRRGGVERDRRPGQIREGAARRHTRDRQPPRRRAPSRRGGRHGRGTAPRGHRATRGAARTPPRCRDPSP